MNTLDKTYINGLWIHLNNPLTGARLKYGIGNSVFGHNWVRKLSKWRSNRGHFVYQCFFHTWQVRSLNFIRAAPPPPSPPRQSSSPSVLPVLFANPLRQASRQSSSPAQDRSVHRWTSSARFFYHLYSQGLTRVGWKMEASIAQNKTLKRGPTITNHLKETTKHKFSKPPSKLMVSVETDGLRSPRGWSLKVSAVLPPACVDRQLAW